MDVINECRVRCKHILTKLKKQRMKYAKLRVSEETYSATAGTLNRERLQYHQCYQSIRCRSNLVGLDQLINTTVREYYHSTHYSQSQ